MKINTKRPDLGPILWPLTNDGRCSRERPFLNGAGSNAAKVIGRVKDGHVEEGVWGDALEERAANVGKLVDLRFQKDFLRGEENKVIFVINGFVTLSILFK